MARPLEQSAVRREDAASADAGETEERRSAALTEATLPHHDFLTREEERERSVPIHQGMVRIRDTLRLLPEMSLDVVRAEAARKKQLLSPGTGNELRKAVTEVERAYGQVRGDSSRLAEYGTLLRDVGARLDRLGIFDLLDYESREQWLREESRVVRTLIYGVGNPAPGTTLSDRESETLLGLVETRSEIPPRLSKALAKTYGDDAVRHVRHALDNLTRFQDSRLLPLSMFLAIVEQVEGVRARIDPLIHDITEHNLRFIGDFAKRFRWSGLGFMDLVNEGALGFHKAVERYDPSTNTLIRTSAGWWVRQAMQNAVATQSRTIRIPRGTNDGALAIKRIASEIQAASGRAPTFEQVALEAGITPEEAEEAMKRAASIPVARQFIQLEGGEFEDSVIPDRREDEVDTAMQRLANIEIVNAAVSRLEAYPAAGKRLAAIIRLRYGLDGEGTRTLKQIGKILRITKERVRQLEAKAVALFKQYVLEAGGEDV